MSLTVFTPHKCIRGWNNPIFRIVFFSKLLHISIHMNFQSLMQMPQISSDCVTTFPYQHVRDSVWWGWWVCERGGKLIETSFVINRKLIKNNIKTFYLWYPYHNFKSLTCLIKSNCKKLTLWRKIFQETKFVLAIHYN